MVVLLRQNHHFSRERPRDNTLVFPPWGGQCARGVAENDHEALKRDTSTSPNVSFYLDRTTTLVANGPVRSPWPSPPREANVREGWLKMTMKLLKETHPRPPMCRFTST